MTKPPARYTYEEVLQLASGGPIVPRETAVLE